MLVTINVSTYLLVNEAFFSLYFNVSLVEKSGNKKFWKITPKYPEEFNYLEIQKDKTSHG